MTSPVGSLLLTGQSLALGTGPYLATEVLPLGVPSHTEARNAFPYTSLKKGTTPYAAMIDWVTGHPSEVLALHVIHGEADTSAGTSQATYEGYLVEWLSDYNADISPLTGQVDAFPMIVDQVNTYTFYGNTAPRIGLAQLDAHVNNADIFLVGPKYQYGTSDGVHLTTAGYQANAKLHRRVFEVVTGGGTWEPVRPLSAVLVGSVITVQFEVPTGNLQFDTTTVAAQTNKGFTVNSDGGAATITDVALGVDGTSVEITVSGTLGANPVVRYGFASELGNLCDSETADSLANWCVHFEQSIT